MYFANANILRTGMTEVSRARSPHTERLPPADTTASRRALSLISRAPRHAPVVLRHTRCVQLLCARPVSGITTMVRAGKRDRTSDGRKVDERDAADTPTRPKVARVTRSSSRRSPRLQRNASTSAGSGGASSPPQTPAARKKQDATKPSTKSKSPKAQATKSRKSPKTPKKAAKSPKLKRKPSLKKSTSAAPLPEGWDLVVPRVDASEDAMVDSISETNPGFKVVNWNINGLNVRRVPDVR